MNLPPLGPMDLYCTPQAWLDRVRRIAPIHLDPCPGPAGWTRARHELRLDRGEDGLEVNWIEMFNGWDGPGLVFANPPYGRGHLDLWLPKIAESGRQVEIVALLPANLEVDAWQKHLLPAVDALFFLAGRARFIDPTTMEPTENTGTKGNVLAYLGDRSKAFIRAFDGLGWPGRRA